MDAKVRKNEEKRAKEWDDRRDKQFDALKKGMEDILAEMVRRNRAEIVAQALRALTDPTQKQMLQEKLVAMVLAL